MPAIALVDDSKGPRKTIARAIEFSLKGTKDGADWSVVDDAPPPRQKDIMHWLDEHDAMVLVADWRLNEGSEKKRAVNYTADALIKEIRARRPTFPIFIVTGYKKEAEAYLRDVEEIFDRDSFAKQAENVVPHMIRAGKRRFDEQQGLLKDLAVLSDRVASGKATTKDREKLKGIQGYFQAEVPGTLELESALEQLDKVRERANAFRKAIEARLKKKPSRRR